MEKSSFPGQEVKAVLIIFCICLFIFFYKLGDRPLWEYDEAKHAQVAKEMLLRGDWVTPTFNGEPFYDKPALHFWLVMLSFLTFGVNEFSARFPSALLGMGGVFLVYAWARSVYGRVSGVLSCLVLATSIEYVILSQNIIHDMSLCFFATLSLFLFHRAYRQGGFSLTGWILFCASLGLAVLAKGPIGVVLPGLIIFSFLLITRKWGLIFNRRTFGGVLVFFMVALPWYLAMAIRNPDFIQSFLMQGNLSRFLSKHPNHQERFYFFLPVLLIGFFPWTTFIPSALLHHSKQYRIGRSPDTLFLLLAAIVPFLFFSLSTTKLATYVLPIFPPLSILVGTFFSCGLRTEAGRGWQQHFRYSCIALFLLLTLGLLGGTWYLSEHFPIYISFFSLTLMAVLFLCGLFVFYFGWKGRILASYSTLAALIVVTLFCGANYILPQVSHFKSAKELSQKVKTLLSPGEPVVFYRDLRESLLFYTGHAGRIIRKKEQLASYLDSPHQVYCIIKDNYYEQLKELLKDKMYIIDREGYFLLVSNKPPGNI
ncbi:MAG: glycosyltransferase family 39 protein [Proteobacteria bacterium]|nr:glycosyltransferase family 39 protein [Pseudomonadota bacterium]